RPRLRAIALGDAVSYPLKMDAAGALATLEAAAGCAISRQMLAASKRGDLFGELAPIECPVTIAVCTNDRLFRGPSYFARFRKLVRGAGGIERDGSAHMPMPDDPERVTATILAGTQS